MFGDKAVEPGGDQVQRLVPAGLAETVALFDQRGLDPVFVVDEVVAVTALNAEIAFIDRGIEVGGDPDHPVVFDVEEKVAAGAAVGAGGFHLGDIGEPPQAPAFACR